MRIPAVNRGHAARPGARGAEPVALPDVGAERCGFPRGSSRASKSENERTPIDPGGRVGSQLCVRGDLGAGRWEPSHVLQSLRGRSAVCAASWTWSEPSAPLGQVGDRSFPHGRRPASPAAPWAGAVVTSTPVAATAVPRIGRGSRPASPRSWCGRASRRGRRRPPCRPGHVLGGRRPALRAARIHRRGRSEPTGRSTARLEQDASTFPGWGQRPTARRGRLRLSRYQRSVASMPSV
jgi:hypothetical protein